MLQCHSGALWHYIYLSTQNSQVLDLMEEQETEGQKEAFITLLSSESYYCGVVALVKSLRHVSQKEMIVMVTTTYKIADHLIEELQRLQCTVLKVDPVTPPDNARPFDPSHIDCFTKFRFDPLPD